LPADLDSDGVVGSSNDMSNIYRVLPVRVRVTWESSLGQPPSGGGAPVRTLEVYTLVRNFYP
jgi:hypothetical protein